MSFLLDTNVLSALLRGNRAVLAHMRRNARHELATSVIVMTELWTGALRSPKAGLLQRIGAIDLPILSFETPDGRCAAEIRAQLFGAGTPIGPLDTLIAGQALARDLTLVTHNTGEFARVPGLRLEDWEA